MSHYKLIEELGRGGMGVVYRAHHARLDRDVAIKFIREDVAIEGEEHLARFRREVELVKNLSHPSVVKILDVGEAEGRPFLVMELLQACTLKDLAKARTMEVAEVLAILDQLLDALEYLHGRGMLHRDIKPENVMIEESGRAVLMDFGLARLDGSPTLTTSRELVGTPRYLAPELVMFQPATPATDLWALGCVAYLVLGGRLPFQGSHVRELISAIVSQVPPAVGTLNPKVSPELSAFVMRFLVRDPGGRWRSAAEARAELWVLIEALSGGREVPAKAEVVEAAAPAGAAPGGSGGRPGRRRSPLSGR